MMLRLHQIILEDLEKNLLKKINKNMIINDRIRDGKLQYNINREAAKLSALSSNKFNKYEYLTGDKILPSNQKQMIEQAKLTYSPLGKAFETNKNNWRTRKKQIYTLKDLKDTLQKKQKKIRAKNYKNKLLILKEREIFKGIYNRRLDIIKELDKKIDYDNLIFVNENPILVGKKVL